MSKHLLTMLITVRWHCLGSARCMTTELPTLRTSWTQTILSTGTIRTWPNSLLTLKALDSPVTSTGISPLYFLMQLRANHTAQLWSVASAYCHSLASPTQTSGNTHSSSKSKLNSILKRHRCWSFPLPPMPSITKIASARLWLSTWTW